MFIYCIIENDTHDVYRVPYIYLSCLQTILTLEKTIKRHANSKDLAKINWCSIITRILKHFNAHEYVTVLINEV